MSQVALNFSISLDGYVAGPDIGIEQPMGAGGERLHEWLFSTPSDEVDRQVAAEAKAAAGAVVIGRRTFDVGIGLWQDTPYPAPCFVLTHEARPPRDEKSGSFVFVDDGIAGAVRAAVEAAPNGGVVLMGADIARQALAAGLVDEINLQLVPIMLGGGRRLFDGIDPRPTGFELVRTLVSSQVVHLRYHMVN